MVFYFYLFLTVQFSKAKIPFLTHYHPIKRNSNCVDIPLLKEFKTRFEAKVAVNRIDFYVTYKTFSKASHYAIQKRHDYNMIRNPMSSTVSIIRCLIGNIYKRITHTFYRYQTTTVLLTVNNRRQSLNCQLILVLNTCMVFY